MPGNMDPITVTHLGFNDECVNLHLHCDDRLSNKKSLNITAAQCGQKYVDSPVQTQCDLGFHDVCLQKC